MVVLFKTEEVFPRSGAGCHYILVARTGSFVQLRLMEWSSQSAQDGHFVGESKEIWVVKRLRFCIYYCNITKPVLIQLTKPKVNLFILLLNNTSSHPLSYWGAPHSFLPSIGKHFYQFLLNTSNISLCRYKQKRIYIILSLSCIKAKHYYYFAPLFCFLK